ncbi:MAG TPA: amino acid deaminase/aldolase [Dermatophilaceae bacterium]|nr:amino acid deaminase/aldolase [Dermatophilaceae bacterium]
MSDPETWTRLGLATAHLPAPLAAVDLEALEANADDLVRRAAGRPIRVASTRRCTAVLRRVLDRPGFRGVLAYAVPEALWLARLGIDDVLVAYPSVDGAALAEVAGDPALRAAVSVVVDSAEHVRFLVGRLGTASGLRVVLDVDASLRVGPLHLGVRRSPVRSPEEAVALARVARDAGLAVVGVMFYDAQVAGLPDTSPVLRAVKRRSVADLHARRAPLVAALREVADLEIVNAGGTGSLHRFGDSGSVTELAAGPGLYAPTLFDGYRGRALRPALAYALDVTRRPGPGFVTAFGGGYAASGPARPLAPAVAGHRGAPAAACGGRRRGPDPAARAGRRRAPARRPGVAAAREGGGAAGALRDPAPGPRRGARGERTHLPR